jgi:thiol-disulfide isomerase/thioredoxin
LLAGANGFYEAGGAVKDHSVESFQKEVLDGDRLWIMEFYAPWCGGCKMVAPWFKEAADSMKTEGVPFGGLDMDGAGRTYSERYGVEGLPHLMAFVPGKEQPVGMGGLGGAESIINFAKERWAEMSADEQAAHTAATEKANIPYSFEDPDADHKAAAIAFDEAMDLTSAIEAFRSAARFTPSAASWNNLAVACAGDDNPKFGTAGNDLEVAFAFGRTLELDPDNENAKEELAKPQYEKYTKAYISKMMESEEL